MKKLPKILLLAVLTISLEARENPFSNYNENVDNSLEIKESIQEEMYIQKIQKEIDDKTSPKEKVAPVVKKPEEKVVTKKELDAIISKTNKQNEQKAKELENIKKELENIKKEPEQVVFVKPRADVLSEDETTQESVRTFSIEKTVLPFLKISIADNKLHIMTDYKVTKKFNLDKENKIVFDFKAKTDFATQRETFLDTNFKSLTVGNHKNAGFFRVAVELSDNPSKYNVDVTTGNITISLK